MRKTVLLVFGTAGLYAFQTPAAFDAASIKPRPPGPGTMMRESAGRLDYVGIPLRSVIARAWKVDLVQVVAPDWVSGEGYEIRATFPANTPPEQFHAMLQGLLTERFHMAIHHEQRELPAYVLSIDKGGLKMNVHPEAAVSYKGPADATGVHFTGTITMPILAQNLSIDVGAPVVDQTGVDGVYDIKLDYASEQGALTSPYPTIFPALQNQLGLKLESKKAPIDVIVVDRIDKTPPAETDAIGLAPPRVE